MTKISLFFICFLALTAWPRTTSLYSQKDLEILESEKNYQEFFAHAQDIRPSLRTPEWKNLVDSMANSYSKSLLNKKNIEDKEFNTLNEILNLPGQKTNLIFKKNRGQIALTYFKGKLQSGMERDSYRQKILRFWIEDQEDFDLGFKLASLYEKGDEIAQDNQVWSFYESAAKSEVAEFYCRRTQFQEALVRHLNLKFNDSHLILKNLISSTMQPKCWNEVRSSLKSALFTAPPEFAMNIYQLLKLEHEIDSSDKDYFSFIFLINGPINGDTFNEAWNTISELKNDYKKREALLERLKQKNHLPDEILASFDDTRKKVITSFIQKSIPEYFDFYARECLSFLKGEKSYPDGNPTLHCRELIELNEKEQVNLVDPLIVLQYQKAVKI